MSALVARFLMKNNALFDVLYICINSMTFMGETAHGGIANRLDMFTM